MAEEKKVSKDRGKWFREMRSELKKVVWPDGKTTAKNTGTVLLCSLIVGAAIWIFDAVAVLAVDTLIGLFYGTGLADNAKWYVAHTYSGYENAVKAAIEKSVVNRGMEDMVLKTEIPMETVTEVTETGVMKEVQRKVFPGYVLIKMVMTDDTWHLIRNIRGVTGFVGEANKAIPLTEDEVAALGMEKREIVVLYHVGDTVRITEGPLSSFTGTVEEIEPEKNRVRVVVSMFGRETPVDLELDQVEVSSN